MSKKKKTVVTLIDTSVPLRDLSSHEIEIAVSNLVRVAFSDIYKAKKNSEFLRNFEVEVFCLSDPPKLYLTIGEIQ